MHMYTAPGICSVGRKSESVLRNKFLDSPILQDEHQVCLREDSNYTAFDCQVTVYSKFSCIFVEGIVN